MPEVHLSSLCTELGTIWCRRADGEEDYDSVDSRVPRGIRPGKKVLFYEVTCSLNKLSRFKLGPDVDNSQRCVCYNCYILITLLYFVILCHLLAHCRLDPHAQMQIASPTVRTSATRFYRRPQECQPMRKSSKNDLSAKQWYQLMLPPCLQGWFGFYWVLP